MEEKQTAIAKISRPASKNIVQRKRLYRLMNKGLEMPVIWLSGPGGSGKTTLVSSFIHNTKLSCLWFQCDEADGDIATFFHYMRIAGQKVAPGKKKPLPLLTLEHLANIPAFTRKYFEDLFSRMKTPSILTLDNYQEVSEQSSFHRVINIAMSVIPDNITVVIISREEPPKAAAHLFANEKIYCIKWDDIRFTPEETATFIHSRHSRKVTSEVIEHLYSETQGWIAGLILLMERVKTKKNILSEVKISEPEKVFDYFASEFFDMLDQKTRDFLIKTAFISKITTEAGKVLTGINESETILMSLTKLNFFTTKYSDIKAEYQYHPLFRKFLLAKGKNILSKKETKDIQIKASELLIQSGQIEDAAMFLNLSKNWSGLTSLILEHGESLLSQGRGQIIYGWITGIPKKYRTNNPSLIFFHGLSCMPFRITEAQNSFKRSFKLFKDREELHGMFSSWSGVVESILFELDNYKKLYSWINIMDEMLKNSNRLPKGKVGERIISSMFAALVMAKPWHLTFNKWKKRANDLIAKSKDVNIRLLTLFHQAYYQSYMGFFSEAKITIQEWKRVLKYYNVPNYGHMRLKLMEVYLAQFAGDQESYVKASQEGFRLSKKEGIRGLELMLLRGQTAWSALNEGDLNYAGTLIDKMEPELEHCPNMNKAFYHYLAGRRYLLLGDLLSALSYTKLSLKQSQSVGHPHAEFVVTLQMAFILFESHQCKKALKVLSCAKKIIGKVVVSPNMKFSYFLIEAYMLLNSNHNKNGSEEAKKLGTDALKKALIIGRKNEYINCTLWHPKVISNLCIFALLNKVEVEYVQFLIRKRNIFPEKPPINVEKWPWRIKIFTLGSFFLLKDEIMITFSGKAQKKPLKMLKAIISLGGQDVRETLISDTLWSDTDGDTAIQAMATTLHRLRKLIGSDAIIRQDGHLSINPYLCWVDCWAFEGMIGEIEDSKGKGNAVFHSKKIFTTYKGLYLGKDNDDHMSIGIRERLHNKFLRAVTMLGNSFCNAKDYSQALLCYEKGLETYILAEEFYFGLMKCYNSMGEKAKAINTYNRCKKNLSAIAGISPSHKTDLLFQAIKETKQIT